VKKPDSYYDKINGIVNITVAIWFLYGVYHSFFIGGETMNLDISPLLNLVGLPGFFITVMMSIIYALYLFLTGVRQYLSRPPRHRVFYLLCIPIILIFITQFFIQIKAIIAQGTLSQHVWVLIFYLLTFYTIIIDTRYQFWRSEEDLPKNRRKKKR
jgi:hypothetical protein